MEKCVILSDSSSTCELADSLKGGSALSEHVHGQWLLTLIDKGDGVIDTVHSENWENGTKQLLLVTRGLVVKHNIQVQANFRMSVPRTV